MPPPSRTSLVVSAVALAGTAAFGLWVVRQGGQPEAHTQGACMVTETRSLGTNPLEVPRAAFSDAQGIRVLLTAPTANGARARVVRVPPQGTPAEEFATNIPRPDAAAGFVDGPDGPRVVFLRDGTVQVLTLGRTAEVRPAPAPPAVEGPALALPAVSHEPDGTPTWIVRGDEARGTRRGHARDTREGPRVTAARRDRYASPDVCLVGDQVLVAQEHRRGTFTDDRVTGVGVEVALIDATAFETRGPAVVEVARDGSAPRIDARGDGAVMAWRDGAALAVASVTVTANPRGAHAGAPVRVPAAGSAHDVVSAAGACGAVVVWRDGDSVRAAGVDVDQGRAGAATSVVWSPGGAGRVRAARAGDRVLVAADGAQGVGLWAMQVGADCATTWAPVAWPAGVAHGAGQRLAGLGGDATRAVLAVTDAALDAAQSTVSFVTVDAGDGVARATPARSVVSQGVSELATLTAPAGVVAGRASRSVQLTRIGDPSDDGEASEDLLLRALRGEDLALAASPARRRVWVADVQGDDASEFVPAHGVVVHSAIETLEDGPRSETVTSLAPHEDVGRMTLDPVTLRRAGGAVDAWATVTSSDGAAYPAGTPCVTGAWATLRARGDDAALAWQHDDPVWRDPQRRALLDPARSSCHDRVHAVQWEGARILATATGPRLGAVLLAGDLDGAMPRAVTITPDGARTAPQLARVRGGAVVLWVEPRGGTRTLRYRYARADGTLVGEAQTLGEVLGTPNDDDPAMAVAGGAGRDIAAVFRTRNGPRMARVTCGDVP